MNSVDSYKMSNLLIHGDTEARRIVSLVVILPPVLSIEQEDACAYSLRDRGAQSESIIVANLLKFIMGVLKWESINL
jgi:hypothetical protein